ncbi:MAG: hypothetical protein M3P48_06425, partial [Actinomycetota bacterium]|nr:hypothetical protein [Actinomycetota bacterium]
RQGPLYVALLAATLAVLMASPSIFMHYGTYATVPFTLGLAPAVGPVVDLARRRVVAGGPSAPARRRWSWLVAGSAGAGMAGVFGLSLALLAVDTGDRFPGARLRPSVADRPCVVSDTYGAGPSRCPQPGPAPWVPAAGRRNRADLRRLRDDLPRRRAVPRPDNPRWQRKIVSYLTPGSGTVLIANEGTGLSGASRDELAQLPVLARAGSIEVLGRPRDAEPVRGG